jgi:hypothetical protein
MHTATLGHHEETHWDGNSGTFGSDDLVVIVREAGRAMARISAESTQTSGFRLERSLGGASAPCYAGGRTLHSRIAQDAADDAGDGIRQRVRLWACWTNYPEIFHRPTELVSYIYMYIHIDR